MEGRERAACEARLNSLRNIQTLLDAASLQFQQYLAAAPSVNLPATAPELSTSTDQAGPSTSSAEVPTTTTHQQAREAGNAQAVE